ncbi:MAG: folate-binding protein [Pseudomonadota bacterium]
MSEMTGYVLADRGVIAMEGADARDVLQGVVTSDVAALSPGTAVYTALLTPQGKYLFDFFLLDVGDDRILIDVQAARARDLAQRLMLYCMRRDAKVVSGPPWQVAQVWGGAPSGDLFAVPDPRLKDLGWRVYGPEVVDALDSMGVRVADASEYDALRVTLGVPETGVELIADDTYILEAGLDRLSGVDFRKGCYVGQEVTARMKHKTQLRKGLVRVEVEGAAAPGTPISANGKPAGTLFTNANGAGLAHLRLDRAGPGMAAGEAIVHYVAD